MQIKQNATRKNSLSEAIVTGAIVMLVVFLISLFLPKQWMVKGKIVVFPSGSPASAGQTLAEESCNTAEIIKSESFQKNGFPDFAGNFSGAKVIEGSSVVLVEFRSSEQDIQAHEDLIVKIPEQTSSYARDIYGGSPFKYKLLGDPEISSSPVRPNLPMNSIIGFVAGFAIYLIWRGAKKSNPSVSEEENRENENSSIVSPKLKAVEDETSGEEKEKIEMSAGEGKVVMVDGRPHFVPKGPDELAVSAPENLPFVDEVNDSLSNAKEPSDEEVKDRLNRLMRGEL